MSLWFSSPAAWSAEDSLDDRQDVVFFADRRPVLIRFHIQIDGKPFRTPFLEFTKELFQSLDRDKNGVLSKEEVEAAPSAQALFNANAIIEEGLARRAINFRSLDSKPADGKVSLQELSDYYERMSGGLFQTVLSQVDGPSIKALNEAIRSRLDANKDGKLSKDELAAAKVALMKLDVDENEMISAQELGPNPYPSGLPRGAELARPVSRGVDEDTAFWVVNAGVSSVRFRRQLITRYGPSQARLNDKNLTRENMRLEPGFFDELDANQDGRLSQDELDGYARRSPDVELRVRIGKSIEVVGKSELARKDKDGSVALEIGNAHIVLRWNPPRADATMRMTSGFVNEQFQAADGDKNGYLEMNEVAENAYLRNSFKVMDADGDGKLYEKEIRAYLEKLGQWQSQALASRIFMQITEGRGLFEVLDTHRDNRLTLRELSQAANAVAPLDTNNDGQLAEGEIVRRYQLHLGRGSLAADPRVARQLIVNDFQSGPPDPSPGVGPLWFRKMDRNRDGDVSPREFLGPRDTFKQLDDDSDGLISAEEAKRADESKPQQNNNAKPK